MDVLYLVSIILASAGQNVLRKPYTNKTGGKGAYFFSFAVSLTALLFFLLTSGGLKPSKGLLPYCLGFATAYATTTVASLVAVAIGSLSLTSLVISYSTIIPALYGIMFLGDTPSVSTVFGMVILAVSLFLINKPQKGSVVSVRWLVCVFVALFANGMCSVIQKLQQVRFDGGMKNEFMVIALAIVSGVMLIFSLAKEREHITQCAKAARITATVSGVLNGIVNLFVMITQAWIPMSVLFPLISAGGIVTTYLASRYIYKEKLTMIQSVGFVLGIASVVFLNI